MNSRDDQLKAMRSTIDTIKDGEMTEIEQFQNTTLRPILKLQHDILLSIAAHELTNRRKSIDSSSPKAYERSIEEWLKKDKTTRLQLIYTVVGHMTLEELTYYHQNRSLVNRRISSMMIKRIREAMVQQLIAEA